MQGRKVADNRPFEVWMKPLSHGARAVILFNRGSAAAPITVTWEEIGLVPAFEANVRDLWAKKDLGRFKGRFTAEVDSHDVVMVRIE